jgi:hypothetical protein
MPLTTNFNVDPYYDDFDPQKNYYRTLFKPGFAVQGRELTQIQTNLQDQIKKFGDHIFKTGSIVTGGQITIQNCNYINIQSTYSGSDISANNFNEKIIVNSTGTKRAYVLKAYGANQARGEPITFIITQSYGDPFTDGETIYTSNSDPTAITYYANAASTNAYGNSKAFSVASGVFYYDGFFVQNQPQSIAVSKYSANGNGLIGFVVSEDIIDYTEDTSLLDPAQSSSNFQAPGADRYKINLTLDSRALDSTDLTKFIELAQFSDGTPQKVIQTPIYGPIVDELARRTYDESGDYVIDNFQIALTETTSNSACVNISLGAGNAYIRGYNFKTAAPTILTVPKPREITSVNNQRIPTSYGYYLIANNYFGNFASNQYDNVAILAIDTGQIPYTSTGVANTNILANATIGTAKIKLEKFYAASGNVQDSNNYLYKIYLTDVNTVSIGANSGYGYNVAGGSKSTVLLPANFATNTSVYKGMSIRFVGGTTDPADNISRLITDSFVSTTTSLAGAAATIVGASGQLAFTAASDQKIYTGQSITISGSETGTQLLSTVSSNGSTGLTLAGVAITGTAGQFSCTARTTDGLFVGQKLVISGIFGGTGSITGYSNPKAYRISATNGTTTFTLVDDATGAAIVTTAGTPTGLTYTLQGSAGSFFCAPSPIPLAVGQVVTITGNPPSGTSGSITGYTGVATNYFITSTDGSRNFTLSTTPGGAAITTASGPLTGLTFTFAGRIIGYSNPTTYLVDATNGVTSATIIADRVETLTLASVQITGTAGQISFTALSKAPRVGDVVVITGTNSGSGTGLAAGTYYVIGSPSTTAAQLSTTPGGSGVTTTAGTTTGLIFVLTTAAVITVPGPNPGYSYSTVSGHVAQIDPPLSAAPTTNWRSIIDTTIFSAESLLRINATSHRIASANISDMNKDMSKGINGISQNQPLFQPFSIQERRKEPLLIKVGESNVADNTLADFSYSYTKLYQGVVFTGTTSSALSYGTGESLQPATTQDAFNRYYRVIVADPSTSPYFRGQTIPADRASVDVNSRTITVAQAVTGMTANVFATINASNPTSKTKTFIKANTILVDPAGGGANNIFGSPNNSVYVSSLDGQTVISESFLVKREGVPQSLFVSDVYAINAIFDFSGQTVSTANYNNGNYINVTSRYSLDTGQKDSYYDWSSITLKPGQTPPRGPLLVRYDRFKSTGAGYFDVDSYTRLGSQENGGDGIDYGLIPIYRSQDGFLYKLSDYLDFRPVRRDANSLGLTDRFTANNFVLDADEANIGTKISSPETEIVTDYGYYLPRIDRVVLTKSRSFQILEGVSSVNPVPPIEPDDAMTLYILRYTPYLYNVYSTQIDIYNNRRYTMRDIAKLDKRVQNLELYTSLSIAELAVINKNDRTIRDANGINRPKNGIFVDSFSDQTGSDITNPSFNAAIDIITRVCRGSYNIASTRLVSSGSVNNSQVEFNGPVLLLASTNTTFIQQNKASKAINVNPFNVINYLGSVKLDPPSDVWKTDDRREAQNIDLTGGNAARDAWSSIQSTTWGAWNTQWTSSLQVSASVTDVDQVQRRSRVDASGNEATGRGTRAALVEDTTTTTTVSASLSQRLQVSRTGVLAQIVPQQLTQQFGDRVIDLTVVHYMRQKNILVLAEKFKPFTSLHAFFDATKVDNYISVLNSLAFTSNPDNSSIAWEDWNSKLEFDTTLSNQETVKLYAATSNTARQPSDTLIGTAGMVLTSGNRGYFVSLPTAFNSFGSWNQLLTNGIWVVGDRSGKTYRAAGWYHRVGRALGGTSVSSTVKTITLAFNAAGALNVGDYVGQKLYILRNTGAGQSGTITEYDSTTRVATVDGLTTTPDTTSDYSIGLLETDAFGACAGIFNCPDGVFRTGEKLFRLIDDEVGNLENSRTNGDTSFYASGIVQTKQETSITVFVPNVTRRQVTEGFVATTRASDTDTSTTTTTEFVRYIDPLAQTFLVNGAQYPQGVVIDSIRVCFKTKDVTESVTCQIRPVVNGYPSATQIYPYAEKVLTPDKVNISLTPSITDSTRYTEFKFDIPVLLLPGEHSFVLLSNSTGYEAFIAGINDTNIAVDGRGAKISEQPYTGSLFLSQNGSVWTADQQNDLMFAIQKRVFTDQVGYGYLEADMSAYSSNSVYDVLQVMSTDAVIANTNISYEFISEMQSGGQHTLLPIIPNEDYETDVDNYGRRILNTVTGNSTFQLRVILSSTNRDISPMIDVNRLNLLTIENKINNLPLQNSGFQITNSGSGYTGNAKVTIGSGGDGTANAYANVTAAGIVDKIVLDNPGNLYITSPTITVAAPTGGSPVTATVVYNGEDKASGGNSNVRYITKRVPLATGFDAGDFRVYMDLYRPPGSGVLVWYKVLAESDPSKFDDNNWLLMTELSDTKNIFSTSRGDYFEATFAPGEQDSGVAANRIRYTSASGTGPHRDFSVFQIKVVLYGSSSVSVPKFGQLRVVALPETTLTGTIIPKTN